MKTKAQIRKRIHLGIRKKIKGTASRPRMSVHRSNKNITCQLIDDVNGVTIAFADAKGISGGKLERATEVGKKLAANAKAQNIENVVFDRAGYLYHGRVKALAEGAREGGLQF